LIVNVNSVQFSDNAVVHGSGMMAAALRGMPGLGGAVFAAGVSNSREMDPLQYAREASELKAFIGRNAHRQVIYFSSFVAGSDTSRYAQHKREMESLIKECAMDFLVLRLPQVVGITKNSTLVSYLVNAARRGEAIKIQRGAFRSLVDVVDVGRVLSLFMARNITREVISVGPRMPLRVLDIVMIIESILGLKIDYSIVDGGDWQRAELSRACQLLGDQDRLFEAGYQYSVLNKYVARLHSEGSEKQQ
jgi:NAD dependent epimerase/dehydratase family